MKRYTCALVGLTAVLICAAGLSAATNDGEAVRHSVTCAPAHLVFTLPEYWEVLPQKRVDTYRARLREMFPGRPVPNYVMAAQRKALFSFSLPYLLVELDSQPMPSVEEVEQEAAAFAANIRRAYVELHRSNLFGEVRVMDAFYDVQRQVIIGSWDMYRARDDQRITAMNAILPFRGGYVRLHFFMAADDEVRSLRDVETVISSAAFEPGYAFEAKHVSTRNTWHYVLYAGVAVMAVMWVGMRIMMRRQGGR